MTPKERTDLEYLFEYFFFFDSFSYPLFGSKPMSVGRLIEKDSSLNGWRAWKKIAHYFKCEKFIIDDYIYNGHPFVLIANLDLVEKIYFQNEWLFLKTSEGRMTLETLKNCLRNRDDLFQEILQNHQILGILLGYGTKNAQIFSENQHLPNEKRVSVKFFTPYHPIFYYFSKVMPPCFACDPGSEETLELKKRYGQERTAIVKLNKKDPLFLRMLILLKQNC